MALAQFVQRDVDELVKKLYKVSTRAKKQSQQAFRQAAPVLISAIQGRAPASEKPHSRYRSGKIVATYHPGNLRRSIKTLTFRRSAAVFVGPKLDKGGSGGEFRGNRTDGYYAHWMEYGAPGAGIPPEPFVKPAVDAAGGTTLRLATEFLKREIQRVR